MISSFAVSFWRFTSTATAVVALAVLWPGSAGTAEAEKSAGPYQPAWESLAAHEVPEWLLDAKYGIYAHWGVLVCTAKQIKSTQRRR